MEMMLDGTYKIYTKEQEKKYGALGIRIELIKEKYDLKKVKLKKQNLNEVCS